jgi:hypothetical protein
LSRSDDVPPCAARRACGIGDVGVVGIRRYVLGATVHEPLDGARHPPLERHQIVAPFEHHRDTPLGALVGDPPERARHPPERRGVEAHVRERIARRSIEARADEHEVRRVRVGDGEEHPLERPPIDAIVAPRLERHVHGEAAPVPRSVLTQGACARIERELMGRHVEDVGLLPEHLLGAVAVVDVPVQDEDAREAACARVRRGDGDRVEETEAHRMPRPGVMARGPNERDAATDVRVDHRVDHADDGAGGASGRFDAAGGEVSVRVERAACAADPLEGLEIAGFVDAAELVERRLTCRDGAKVDEGLGGCRSGSREAFGALGVVPG